MIVRALTRADVDAWTELEDRVFARAWSGAMLLAELRRDDAIALGAFDGPTLVGMANARVSGPEAELHRIAVAPEARRGGTGRDLLDAVCRLATKRGATVVFLEVAARNLAAVRLYEAVGFGIVGRRRDYYPNPPDDALVMRLPPG